MYQYWFTNSDKYTGQMLDVNNRGNNNTPKRSLGLCLSLSHPFHLSLSSLPLTDNPVLPLGEENHRVVSNFTKIHTWQGNEASLHQVLRSSDLPANMRGCGNISFSPSAPSHHDGLRQHLDRSLLRSPESESHPPKLLPESDLQKLHAVLGTPWF